MKKTYEQEAAALAEAIRTLASNPDHLANLESYLTYNFQKWLDSWANTPEGIAAEMQSFANMEF